MCVNTREQREHLTRALRELQPLSRALRELQLL